MIVLRSRRCGGQEAAAPELVELTSSPADEATAWFHSDATPAERARAARLAAAGAGVYVHAHGALHRRFAGRDVRHWSLSYARGRAWAALSHRPVGLDVVDAGNDGPLDPGFASPAECAAVAMRTRTFPPRLAVWAAKEAAAKLTGLVDREPEAWRVGCERGVIRVSGDDGHSAIIDFVALEAGLLAAVARTHYLGR